MNWGKTISGVFMRWRSELRGLALMLVGGALLVFACHRNSGSPAAAPQGSSPPSDSYLISPTPFEEVNGADVFNASGVVPLGDSRFLFCDNNSPYALFELDLTPDGKKKGPLIRRPLNRLLAGAIEDLEGMTLAEEKEHRFLVITSSMFVKKSKTDGLMRTPPSGLLRVKIKPNNRLVAENMRGFRTWFLGQAPQLAPSAAIIPDEGGLNIEGLAWDSNRHALLFGVRTPLSEGKPLILPVQVKELAGPWKTDNLKMLPPIRLSIDATEGEQGIRDLQYIPARNAFLVIVGKTISDAKAPFALYEWDGNPEGKTRRLNVSFAKKMKPEGVTQGTVGGKPVLLFVDDGGGYQVVWLDSKPF